MKFKIACRILIAILCVFIVFLLLRRAMQPLISREDMTWTVLYVALERAELLQRSHELPLGEVNALSLPPIHGKIDRLSDGWDRPVRLWKTLHGMSARSSGPDGIWETSDDMVAESP